MPIKPSDVSPAPRTDRRASLFAFGLALAGLVLVYFLTIPANHTEAEDGYWYAYDTGHKGYHALFHIHHLLYLPLMRLVYTAGHFTDAFSMMIRLDILCAVATVGLLFIWLRRGLELDWRASLFASLFLAFCYGFWRYALEAEVYLPALVLMVFLASRVFRLSPSGLAVVSRWGDEVLTSVVGAASVLMHAPLSAPLAVVAVPCYLLIKRRFRAFVVYGAVATVLVTACYYAAYRAEIASHDPELQLPARPTFAGFLAGEGGEEPYSGLTWSDLPKAATGLGASVVSSNYLFAIPKTHDKLFAAFPARNFTEEDFMARSYSRTLAYLGLVLTVVLLGIIGFTAVRRLEWNGPRCRALFTSTENLAIFLWLGGYCLLVCIIEPEDPENWVCSLLPIAAVAGLCVHYLYTDLPRARLPWVFVALLVTQNLVGGFFIIHSPQSDFNIHKGAWIVSHARAGDVVFTRDNEVFTRYLRYHTPARVINLYGDGGRDTRDVIEHSPAEPQGARYLFVDVVEPPHYVRVRFPALYDDLSSVRQELLPVLTPTDAEDVKRLPPP